MWPEPNKPSVFRFVSISNQYEPTDMGTDSQVSNIIIHGGL